MIAVGKKHRDLTFIDLNSEDMLVIACDSCGAIGDKEHDVVKVKPEVVGFYTAQVALMEVVAIGANPIALVNNLSVEMHNTGEEIVKGIKKALTPLKLKTDIMLTGSTEENFPVCQTAMGVTVIGTVNKNNWNLPKTNKGNLAVVVGIPKVGQEIVEDRGLETLSLEILLKLKGYPEVNEIVPVGSKGILYELKEMAKTNNLLFTLDKGVTLDLKKPAGPATCAIFSIEEKELQKVKGELTIPVNVIGQFN